MEELFKIPFQQKNSDLNGNENLITGLNPKKLFFTRNKINFSRRKSRA
jgi:hypothetical protein